MPQSLLDALTQLALRRGLEDPRRILDRQPAAERPVPWYLRGDQ